MCGTFGCGVATTVVGALLVFASSFVGYYVIPDIVESEIIKQVVLANDTEAMERYEDVPFALNFTVRLFNITNPDAVAIGGVPVVSEVGPYTYRLRQRRVIEEFGDDYLVYRHLDLFEFNEEASYPNREDDVITIVNVPFHAVMNGVEQTASGLLGVVNLALNGIFGEHTGPVTNFRVRDLLFDGVTLCQNSLVVSGVACSIIRAMSADIQNLEIQPDNSLKFAVLAYRNGTLGERYNVSRGLENSADLGRISLFAEQPYFRYWPNTEDGELSVCNMINGTDSGIFHPFVDITEPLYAINPDICRSLEIRYERDVEFEGIPGVRFTADEWMLDNDDGCFCLNITQGLKGEDGCMHRGAVELYTCLGAHLIMSYPHFLYADPIYRNGVIGLTPNRDDHRIFLDIEPNTGVVMRGAKRAQFSVFMRPLQGITSTQSLRTTLTPIFWIEESVLLPEEYVDLLKNEFLFTLRLLQILIPVFVAVCCVVFVAGVALLFRNRRRQREVPSTRLSAQEGLSEK